MYHVMNRRDPPSSDFGAASWREAIFKDAGDRRKFLGTPSETCSMAGWQVHA
jgi:hypothetical protein